MNLVTIVADSAAEALAEIHRQLGPQAVVVNVRKTPAPGIAGIWKRGKIEVQATLPTPPQTAQPVAPAAAKKKPTEAAVRRSASIDSPNPIARRTGLAREVSDESFAPTRASEPLPAIPVRGELDLGKMLENLGILPLHAQSLVDQVRANQRGNPTKDLREEFRSVQDFLLQYWERLAARTRNTDGRIRVFVGAPGVGKTTCLCKWLTQEVLLKSQSARVWRLDSHTANTAEFLSIHGEILGVPVERVWDGGTSQDSGIQFVDLPGVSLDNPEGLGAFENQLKGFENPQVLLVLNAAYDLGHLLAQARAFSSLGVSGIVLSHLDEDNRWSKFWNLLLGAKLPILYLSGGQQIPGQFVAASPQSLFDVLPDDLAGAA